MKFSTPIGYTLVVGIVFHQGAKQAYQKQTTKIILNELAEKIKLNLNKSNYIKKEKKQSISIAYFVPKEGSYKGAKKEMQATLIKFKHILDALSDKYNISFKAYLYHDLADFFQVDIDF